VQALLAALPYPQWVAENENTVLMRQDGRNYLRTPAGAWTEYTGEPAELLAATEHPGAR
jgi:hypothetical protein